MNNAGTELSTTGTSSTWLKYLESITHHIGHTGYVRIMVYLLYLATQFKHIALALTVL